jgi:hypothetical protein
VFIQIKISISSSLSNPNLALINLDSLVSLTKLDRQCQLDFKNGSHVFTKIENYDKIISCLRVKIIDV